MNELRFTAKESMQRKLPAAFLSDLLRGRYAKPRKLSRQWRDSNSARFPALQETTPALLYLTFYPSLNTLFLTCLRRLSRR